MSDERNNTVFIFLSYAHEDEKMCEDLKKHLSALRTSGLIREWYDREILAGTIWADEIDEKLEAADIVLFLISADFLASEYCTNVEGVRALERSARGEAIVVPVILTPVVWEVIESLARLGALPKDAVPVTSWKSHDDAFENVCEGILRVIKERHPKAASIRPLVGSGTTSQPEQLSAERFFDAAIPATIEIGRTIVLVVMVRTAESEGLKQIVTVNDAFGVTPNDVVSDFGFDLEFEVDEDGKPLPRDLRISIEAPDFTLRTATKTLRVEPSEDSEPLVFMLAANRVGALFVNVEVLVDETVLTGCLLNTECVATVVGVPASNYVSVPVKSVGQANLHVALPAIESPQAMIEPDYSIHTTGGSLPSGDRLKMGSRPRFPETLPQMWGSPTLSASEGAEESWVGKLLRPSYIGGMLAVLLIAGFGFIFLIQMDNGAALQSANSSQSNSNRPTPSQTVLMTRDPPNSNNDGHANQAKPRIRDSR